MYIRTSSLRATRLSIISVIPTMFPDGTNRDYPSYVQTVQWLASSRRAGSKSGRSYGVSMIYIVFYALQSADYVGKSTWQDPFSANQMSTFLRLKLANGNRCDLRSWG